MEAQEAVSQMTLITTDGNKLDDKQRRKKIIDKNTHAFKVFEWINAVYFVLMTWIRFSRNILFDDIIRRTKDLFIYLVKKEMSPFWLTESE